MYNFFVLFICLLFFYYHVCGKIKLCNTKTLKRFDSKSITMPQINIQSSPFPYSDYLQREVYSITSTSGHVLAL